jgi:branched-chain amino acid transport system permease protein
MDWTVIVMQLFTGLSLGMLYVMLALGLSIIFGLLTVVNFAHGAMYMWGAYAGVSIVAITGNFWLALIITPLVIGVLSLKEDLFARFMGAISTTRCCSPSAFNSL